jgi:hypothetical protein
MAYIGRQLARGENKLFDDISSSFNGSTTTFTLAVSSVATATATPYQLFVSLGGVMQKPNTDFTTAGNQITFTTAPAAGLSCWIMMQGDTIDQAAIPDSSVTPSKISGSNFAFSGDLRLKDADGSHYVGFASPSTVSTNKVWTLPAADGSASQYLQTNGSGVLTWASVTIGGATGIDFNDNVKARWGTGNDLEIYHSGSNAHINHVTSGNMFIDAVGDITFRNTAGTENRAKFANNGAVELYHDNVKKFETSAAGVSITGALTVSTNATITGDLTVSGTTTTINTQTLDVEDKNVVIGKVSSPSDTTADGGGWTLKGATDKTFNWVNATDAWTSSEHIHILDSKKLLVGTGSDFQISHTGSHTELDSYTGNLSIRNLGTTGDIYIDAKSGERGIKVIQDGAVELYHDNSKKVETNATGINVTGAIQVNGAALSTAPEITATAHGTVTAERAVMVRSDGKVEAVANVPASNGSFTDMNPFNNQGKLTRIATNNNGQYVLLEDTNVSNGLNATVLTVSGTTVTKNSATTISTSCSQTGNDDRFDISYDSTADKFLVVYINTNGSVRGKTLTISGTGSSASLSQGTEMEFDGNNNSEFVRCAYDSDQSKTAVIADVGNDGFCWAATISGTSITKSSRVQIDEGKTPFQQPNMCYDNKNKLFQILWRQSSSGNIRPQTLTWDASNARYNGYSGVPPILWGNGYEGPISIAHVKDTDGYLCHYKRSDNVMYARVITSNSTGSTITAGSETQTHASYAYRPGDMKHDSLNEKMMLISRGTDGFIDYKVLSYNVTNRTLSVDSTTILANSSTNPNSNTFVAEGINAAFDTTNYIFLCSFAKQQSGSYSTNQVMAIQRPSTTLDATKFIGFAASTVTDGNTATVKIASNTSTQSSLTPARKYYVQGDGTIGLTAIVPSVEAGLSLSATSLLIKG